MKKSILTILSLAAITSAVAQSFVGEIRKVEFDSFNLHIYTSTEAMGDISILVEGEKSLVVLEPQSFYKSIDDFNQYINSLGKPIEKIVANYHAGGLASVDMKKVVMIEPMVEFMGSPAAQGMMQKFEKVFQGAMDTRAVKVRRTIPTESTQEWAGVEFNFTSGACSDFPASSVEIGGKVFYTHFAPNRAHPAPMQVGSIEAVDVMLGELLKAQATSCEIFVGSHGQATTREDLEFMISYLERMKSLRAESNNSDIFAQKLLVSYPDLAGAENIKSIAKGLYPNEQLDSEKEAVRAQAQAYLDFMSSDEFDQDKAKALWIKSEDVSFISPAGQFFGVESITGTFMRKIFSLFKSHKLSSLCEMVNVYGDSANVQLYWKFDTINHQGVANQTRGRESLIYQKIDGEWLLVHVHYSRMPENAK